MALRRGWRFAGLVPRLLFCRPVLFASSAPRGRSFACSLVKTPSGCTNRDYSSGPQSPEVTYEQLKQILAARSAVVIDVREPWELREYGFIPGAVNVPLGQVNTALQLGPEEFKEKYGSEMPLHSDNIVFSCLAGIRSKQALDMAESLGYKEAQHYPGGWKDWEKHEQHK
ncbi:unnamed protein product [Ophioblennius macclurei]